MGLTIKEPVEIKVVELVSVDDAAWVSLGR